MPLDLGIQVYFVDSTQNWLKLDSLFNGDKYIFRSGEVNADGKVIGETEEPPIRVELSRAQIENIMDANKILVRASVNTFESQSRDVKFHAGDYLDFNLGVRLKLNLILEGEQAN